MSYTIPSVIGNNDCNDCKDAKYIVRINTLNEIWSIEKLSLLLNSIEVLGFTKNQCSIVAENILDSKKPYKIFTGEKDIAFKVLDRFLENQIEAGITKIEKGLEK